MNNYKTLLYSSSQDCFHIETLQETIEKGVVCYLKKQGDYILLGIFEDEALLQDTINKLKNIRLKI